MIVHKRDCVIDVYTPHGMSVGMSVVTGMSKAVRVTHVPSGIRVIRQVERRGLIEGRVAVPSLIEECLAFLRAVC